MAPSRPAPPLRPERLLEELHRVLDAVIRETDEVIRHPRPTPASLHRLHRDLRRLRTGLEVWKELSDSADAGELHLLDVRVRRLARLVGQVRDRDVILGLLAIAAGRARTDEERERLRVYRTRLEEDARTGRELLRAFLRSERQARLFEEVGAVFRLPRSSRRVSRLRRVLGELTRRSHEKVVAAHRKARRRPSMQRFHRLRIRVRQFRQMAELASTVDPTVDPKLAESLRRLQQHLGRLHDLDVLLRDLDPRMRASSWAETLRKDRRLQRETVERALDARRPRPPASDPSRATGRARPAGTVRATGP